MRTATRDSIEYVLMILDTVQLQHEHVSYKCTKVSRHSTTAKYGKPCAVLHVKAACSDPCSDMTIKVPSRRSDGGIEIFTVLFIIYLNHKIVQHLQLYNHSCFNKNEPAEKLETKKLSNSSCNLSFKVSEDIAFL